MDNPESAMNKATIARRSGGPRSASGKAVASRNALKTGVATILWIDESEQARYEDLVAQLAAEYSPQGSTLALLIEHLALAQQSQRSGAPRRAEGDPGTRPAHGHP
jgi:hypothetical protein